MVSAGESNVGRLFCSMAADVVCVCVREREREMGERDWAWDGEQQRMYRSKIKMHTWRGHSGLKVWRGLSTEAS
jgi:hypothetical protein